jgi:nucleoside-diphosphate-sugar epimerase
MKRVLVTGAGGYVGVPLFRELVQRGYHVLALDRYFFGKDSSAISRSTSVWNSSCRTHGGLIQSC